MRQLRNNIALCVLMSSALALSVLAGCGGGGGSSDNAILTTPARADLVGTWRYKSVGQPDGNSQVACPGGFFESGSTTQYAAYCGASDTLVLNNDGTYTNSYTAQDATTIFTSSGTWSVVGDSLSLTYPGKNGGSVTVVSTISLSTDKKTFIEYFSQYTIILSKQ